MSSDLITASILDNRLSVFISTKNTHSVWHNPHKHVLKIDNSWCPQFEKRFNSFASKQRVAIVNMKLSKLPGLCYTDNKKIVHLPNNRVSDSD